MDVWIRHATRAYINDTDTRSLTCRRHSVRRVLTTAIIVVYANISRCLQHRELAAYGNFRNIARTTNYRWHRADYPATPTLCCWHPRQIIRDRTPPRRWMLCATRERARREVNLPLRCRLIIPDHGWSKIHCTCNPDFISVASLTILSMDRIWNVLIKSSLFV